MLNFASQRRIQKKTCWGKGTKTKTKIWHTVTYYHTDNVSTLITVLNTRPARISSRYFTQRFTKMLVRSSGRSPSSPNLFFTRTNSNSFCSCQKATSKKPLRELFASTLSVDFLNSFGRDPRLRRPLTRTPQPGNRKDIRIRCKDRRAKEVANIARQRQFRFLSWQVGHIDKPW